MFRFVYKKRWLEVAKILCTYCESPFVMGPKLRIDDGIRKLEVSLCLLIAFQHEHAATEVVVNSCRVYCVSTET